MSKKFTLGKTERLKSRKIIDQLFSEGKAFTQSPFRVHYLFAGTMTAPLQFGAGASTRNFKKAVDRNRIKRLIKEAWRLQKPLVAETVKEQNTPLAVFVIYTAKELPAYDEVVDKMQKITGRLCTLVTAKK